MSILRHRELRQHVRLPLWSLTCKIDSLWRGGDRRRRGLALWIASGGLALAAGRQMAAWAALCDTFNYPPSCGQYGPVRTGITYQCCGNRTVIGGGGTVTACCQWTCTQLYCDGNPSITGYKADSIGSWHEPSHCVDPPGTCS